MTKGRSRRGGRRGGPRGPHNPGQGGSGPRSIQTNNAYALLADMGDNGNTGEMNGHIAERFSRSGINDPYPDPERVPLSIPTRTNDDIRKYYQDAKKPVVNAGAWIEQSEIPRAVDILSSPSSFTIGEQIIDFNDIRPNKVEGAYASNEDYLRTQYELLREDAIRPLREAVEEVRKDPWRTESQYPPSSGIGIYEPVYITSIVFSNRGLATKVAFSLGRVQKFIRWKQSKRLITGSLVALTPYDDAFQSKCILATIAARPLSSLESANPPEIDLFFARPEEFEFDPAQKWIMVESRSSFYEASRHTLLALQHLMQEPFPLSDHLVMAKKDVEPPAYVQHNPYTDMSSIVSMEEAEQYQNLNILEEWLSGDTHGLDKSQSTALRRILTKSLAIVQGPPGTGKTHVSVVALKVLLANMRKGDPPIIVTCQTNHALDQLLRHVAEFEPDFIRLGGRSKDKDKIKKRTLFEVRSSYSQPRIPGSRKNRSLGALRQLTSEMQQLLEPWQLGKGPLEHSYLVKMGLLSEKQAESLEIEAEFAMGISQDAPGIQMEQWLGKCLMQCLRPVQPDDFGMDFEEDDFDEVEQLEELEAEAVARDDDDIEALKGPVSSISDNYSGRPGGTLRTDEDIQIVLDKTQDLTTIPVPNRGAIYNYLQRQAKKLVLAKLREMAKEYDQLVLHRKIGQWEQDQALLLDQRLIGMTTTGLSKYRSLISSLRPRIVLVEEAAETLEAPVTAACVPSLEHLILVGDHKQLRPHCQVHEFEDEPYYFNLSLFERMVFNEVQVDCLTRQRRMIPEVRRLLEPIYGNTLKDHASVIDIHNRPHIEGMGGCNSFFFTHEWPESRDANMSYLNMKEADMIVGFIDYLILNGVNSRKITILTFYNGQRSYLTKKLRLHPNLRSQPFNVVTVDSYQGEENDIVILSLVRSNRKGIIGFLSVDNRVCVALSRAKRGFYIFGNAEMLACESDTWGHVVNIMYGKGKVKDIPTTGQKRRLGYMFPLECVNHGYKTWIEDPKDWEYINGGCDETCRCTLPCGHMCVLKCHPFDNGHVNCTQKCNKRLPACGHPCSAVCCDPCKCMICDRRSNGVKALLKPAKTNGNNSAFKAPPQVSPVATLHAHPFVAAPSMAAGESSSTPEQWKAYASGGAKIDDARALEKRKEADAKFEELISNGTQSAAAPPISGNLIEVSPKKKAPMQTSENTDLLIDLAMDVGIGASPSPSKSKPRYRSTEIFSYTDAATTKPETKSQPEQEPPPIFNLLD